MKLLSYTVNMRLAGNPAVVADVLLDGEEVATTFRFQDDEAREIVDMIDDPAPGRTGKVARGPIVREALDSAISRRLAETTPATVATMAAEADVIRARQQAETEKHEATMVEQREEIERLNVAINQRRDAAAAAEAELVKAEAAAAEAAKQRTIKAAQKPPR